MLAPLARVANYSRGVWLRLEVEAAQSVRLRFANIRGTRAISVSALAIDEASAGAAAG